MHNASSLATIWKISIWQVGSPQKFPFLFWVPTEGISGNDSSRIKPQYSLHVLRKARGTCKCEQPTSENRDEMDPTTQLALKIQGQEQVCSGASSGHSCVWCGLSPVNWGSRWHYWTSGLWPKTASVNILKVMHPFETLDNVAISLRL